MLMCQDALTREESCGGHFRAEHQTEEGEALRDDENFAHVAAWEWSGDPMAPNRASANNSSTKSSSSRRGATSERRDTPSEPQSDRHEPSDEHHPQDLAPDGPRRRGSLRDATSIDEISDEASFLEMLDILNERLIEEGKEAIVFDHDCREGICGTCSLMIDGQAHGPQKGTATCQLHMRTFA